MFVKSNRGWLLLAHLPIGGGHVDEYLHLRDTRDNRRVAERLKREIEAETLASTFEYARRFPNSKNLARLGLRAPVEPTLGEFALSWLDEQRRLTPASHNHYRLLLKNHLLGYSIAGKRLADVTDGDVGALVATEGFHEKAQVYLALGADLRDLPRIPTTPTAAEIPGFMGNLEELHETEDYDVGTWRPFLELWWAKHHDTPISVTTICQVDNEYSEKRDENQRAQGNALRLPHETG